MMKDLIRKSTFAPVFLVCLAWLSVQVNAQSTVTEDQVINALTPANTSATRSLVPNNDTAPSLSDDEKDFLKNIPTRGLKFETVKQVEKIIKEKKLPALDIEIRFRFASHEIDEASKNDLAALGKALLNPALADSRILLNGHTDAKGGEDYNLRLSRDRATAVRSYLISEFSIPENRLIAVGLGETRLKNQSEPESDVNRRVEVVNLGH